MSVIRTKRRRDFTIVPNDSLRDNTLSWAAKGLLALMLSYPDDWQYSLKHLASMTNNGLHATRSAFQELEAAGYVTRTITRSASGTITGYEYTVRDDRRTVVRFPDDGLSDDGFSDDGKPHATKTYSTNTDLTKTEETKERDFAASSEARHMEYLTTGHAESQTATPARAFFRRLIGTQNANHPQARDELTRWYTDHGETAIRDLWTKAKDNPENKPRLFWFIDALNGLKGTATIRPGATALTAEEERAFWGTN